MKDWKNGSAPIRKNGSGSITDGNGPTISTQN